MCSNKYQIKIEKYAERHYIKKFRKNYKKAWECTWGSIEAMLVRIHKMEKEKCNDLRCIVFNDQIKIFKFSFRVARTNFSAKRSGNRIILVKDSDKEEVLILLVYNKNDLPDKNETAAWKSLIKKNYPKYGKLL